MTEIFICGGPGGVGKTTVSAALSVGLALAGRRVVVLTIDPARRLADALGLDALSNEPSPVPLEDAEGTLDAVMLDRKATWDGLVRRYANDPDHAAAVMENRYYRAVSTRLTGSHEYMATEKLHELVESGRWDAVVVDTPPSQHAVEFFNAPSRMRRILDGKVFNVITSPGTGLLSGATRKIGKLILGLAGQNVVDDIREFFHLFRDMSDGMRDRNGAVQELLRSPNTRLFVVTSANEPDRKDALEFLAEVRAQEMHFGGFIVNRVRGAGALGEPLSAADMPERPAHVGHQAWTDLVRGLLELPGRADRSADLHLRGLRQLQERTDAPIWAAPEHIGCVRTLDGLMAIASALPPASLPLARIA